MTTIDRAALRRPLEDYIRSRGYVIQSTSPEREDITVKHLLDGDGWVLDVIDLACALIHARDALDAAEARETVLRAALTMDGQTVQGVLREYAAWVAWPHSGYDPGPPVLAWADRIDAALALPDAGEAP